MFMAFLQKKNLLYEEMFNYIMDYWEDIIKLVQNPLGEGQMQDEIAEGERQHTSNNPESINLSPSDRLSPKTNSLGSEELTGGKKEKDKSEFVQLKEEQEQDDSILAY